MRVPVWPTLIIEIFSCRKPLREVGLRQVFQLSLSLCDGPDLLRGSGDLVHGHFLEMVYAINNIKTQYVIFSIFLVYAIGVINLPCAVKSTRTLLKIN